MSKSTELRQCVDKESVPHILLHCRRFVEARSELEDSVEVIYTEARSSCSGLDKVTFMVAPGCSDKVSKKDNFIIKDALFRFIDRSGMKL